MKKRARRYRSVRDLEGERDVLRLVAKWTRTGLLGLALGLGLGTPSSATASDAPTQEPATQPAPEETPEERKTRLVEEILELEALEARKARSRMEAFLYRYLGPKKPGGRALFDTAPGAFHRGIYADFERALWKDPVDGKAGADALAYAYPRGHGKTTVCVLGLVLWTLHEWRSMPHFNGKPPFILIVSDTVGQARDRLLDIRDELETNADLRAAYGSKVPDTRRRRSGSADDDEDEVLTGTFKWTETEIETVDGCRVMAVGTGSKKIRGLLRRSARPSLIVCDDLENDEHVGTKGQRTKLEKWFTKALIPTGLEGELLTVVVGTILHADSLLSRLLDPTQFEGWVKRRYAAAWGESGLPSAEGPHVLWPGKWPLHLLHARRSKIGSVAFAQEYLNQAVDDLTALFKRAWLTAARQRGEGAGFSYGPANVIPFSDSIATWDPAELTADHGAGAVQLVITAWDVALVADERKAQERDTDYTVGLTVELTADDRIRVRRIYRKRGMTPADMRRRVIAENVLLQPEYVIVENNTASMAHEIELRGIPGLPLRGHTTDSKKHSVYEGVPGLALLFELGRIDFCWANQRERAKIDVLIDELHGLGVEAHDDTVMALWMAVVNVRKWQRIRDAHRRRFVGPPPAGYLDPWPTREAA